MNINKHFYLTSKNNWIIILILSAVCLIQGVFLYYHMNSNIQATMPSETMNSNQLTDSLLDKFKSDRRKEAELFNGFFNDDFFSNRHDPFADMEEFRQKMLKDMEKLHKSTFSNSWDKWFDDRFTFNNLNTSNGIDFNMNEESDRYVMTLNVPNMKNNNLNVEITESYIAISGHFTQINEVKNANGVVVSRSEIQQNLSKRLPLPFDANYEKAAVEHKENSVVITLPKIK